MAISETLVTLTFDLTLAANIPSHVPLVWDSWCQVSSDSEPKLRKYYNKKSGVRYGVHTEKLCTPYRSVSLHHKSQRLEQKPIPVPDLEPMSINLTEFLHMWRLYPGFPSPSSFTGEVNNKVKNGAPCVYLFWLMALVVFSVVVWRWWSPNWRGKTKKGCNTHALILIYSGNA